MVTYKIIAAQESGFETLTPAVYFVNLPEVVSYPASAPKEMVGVPMVADKSTAGDWFRATAVVKVPC